MMSSREAPNGEAACACGRVRVLGRLFRQLRLRVRCGLAYAEGRRAPSRLEPLPLVERCVSACKRVAGARMLAAAAAWRVGGRRASEAATHSLPTLDCPSLCC
eukprot:5404870-Pleurochrysis_carterae.AAC.1